MVSNESASGRHYPTMNAHSSGVDVESKHGGSDKTVHPPWPYYRSTPWVWAMNAHLPVNNVDATAQRELQRDIDKLKTSVKELAESVQRHDRELQLAARVTTLEREVATLKKQRSRASSTCEDEPLSQHAETEFGGLSQFLLDTNYPFNK